MEMSLIEKIIAVFKYLISSFMSIEIFLIILLFFGLMFLNVKQNNLYFKIAVSSVLIMFFIALSFFYFDYVKLCYTQLIKLFLNLLYFPSVGIYFTYLIFVSVFLIYNVINTKLDFIYRRINILSCGVIYLFYLNVVALIATSDVDIADKASVYSNDQILSFIQMSNLLLIIWILFIFGYFLFKVFRKEDN